MQPMKFLRSPVLFGAVLTLMLMVIALVLTAAIAASPHMELINSMIWLFFGIFSVLCMVVIVFYYLAFRKKPKLLY